jgi:thioredoxin reductase
MIDNYDVIVIGGGAAGLSGAIALARSRRTVLVIDAGDPRNAPAGHVHNFLTQDGTPPAELYQKGRRELAGYGGEVAEARVESITRDGDLFRVSLGGRRVEARRLLVTTGARDELPDVPGLAERWGRDVLHCPYCHGWEVRDQRVGVLSTSPAAAHQALLFRQLTGHVTVLTHRGPGLTDEQRGQFGDLGIAVVDGEVAAVESADDHLTGVRLADGAAVRLDALVVAPVCRARAELLAPLGLEPAEFRVGDTLMGTYVAAGPGGSTPVRALYVAGNIADVQAQVVSAAAAGLMAGAAINTDLIMTDAAAAARSSGQI